MGGAIFSKKIPAGVIRTGITAWWSSGPVEQVKFEFIQKYDLNLINQENELN